MTLNVVFLSILYIMHYLWFYMFMRINLQIIKGGVEETSKKDFSVTETEGLQEKESPKNM